MNEAFGMNEEPSYSVTIYIAGDLADAIRSLRRQCIEEGLCVTVTSTTFVYTHGLETGVAVGLVNYPRFPKTKDEIWGRARTVALTLREDLFQRSAILVGPDRTEWLPLGAADLKQSI